MDAVRRVWLPPTLWDLLSFHEIQDLVYCKQLKPLNETTFANPPNMQPSPHLLKKQGQDDTAEADLDGKG